MAEKDKKNDRVSDKKQTIEKKPVGKKPVEKKFAEKRSMEKKPATVQPCSVMGKCGGCKWLNLSYEEQLHKKEKTIKELCGRFCKFAPIIGMENPYHYRNKVHAVFGQDRRHNIVSGTYEEKTHHIVPVDSCLLDNEQADRIILTIRKLLKSFKIRTYDEDTGYGLFRHVLVRVGKNTGQIMVVLVIASPIMPSKNNFVKALLKEHPEITTVVLNINGRGTSKVLGDKETVLYGKGYIEDELCSKTFRISAQSFYQVNPVQTEKMYNKAMEFACLTGKETVLDAYCGTGTIGIIASGQAKEVIGVELNKAAIADARLNAKRNDVKNITFYEKDAGQFMVQMAEQNAHVDVVFMDPPRAGSDEAFLGSLVRLKPAKVVYISCNPETLARDLTYLTKHGYKVEKGVGVDMFPWTTHVETVCLLSRKAAV
ncbi:MAG: 23S rRNA (uracil(1939)-C(5))-methyltransferase RlmD [Lachnospiraceae bacterium]